MTILGWYENSTEQDIPPEHIWDDAEGLDLWWKKVRARQEAEYSSGADDTIPDEEDMMGNALARSFKDS